MVAKRSGNNNKIKKAITIADKVVLKATKSWGVLSFSDAMSPVKTFFSLCCTRKPQFLRVR